MKTSLPFARNAISRALQIGAATLALAASGAFAVDNSAAFARAVDQVQAFPGRTAHGAGHSYGLRDVITDANGSTHVRLERFYKGLRVIGGDLIVHSNGSGAFIDATHSISQTVALDIRARLGGAEALRAALAQRSGSPEGAPQLVVYARGDRAQLAYDVMVTGTQADGTPSRLHVIIDAASGQELDSWNDIKTVLPPHFKRDATTQVGVAGVSEEAASSSPNFAKTGTGKTLYLGDVALPTDRRFNNFGKYKMLDLTRGGQKTNDMNNSTGGSGTTFSDTDNIWGNNATSDRATVGTDAHFGGALTWDYFLQVHGRNGIKNNGVGAFNRVHYSTAYDNAFWDGSCFCMTYGDGSFFNPLVSIDVAGHEMTHGVTENTAGLIYSGESGGLNEGTSDIFGTMVEYFANNAADTPDYLIGEKIYKTPGGFLRSMVRPSVDGVSADCWYAGVGNIDVHYSSGVANHFFFLLAEGTTAGNPSPTCAPGNTRVATGAGTLVGIGRAKAEKIWFRALTVYMTPSTNYAAARTATINASNDLYGSGSPESVAVAAAWTAVNRP